MIDRIIPTARVYDPPGRCIYCGASDDANLQHLSREHIIPHSLGGRLVFRHASCQACADITKLIEQRCSRTMFIQARTKLGLPTYRPKERPTHFRTALADASGNIEIDELGQEVYWRDISAIEHPFCIFMMRFDHPTILSGLAPTGAYQVIGYDLSYSGDDLPLTDEGIPLAISQLYSNDWLCRLLAKIAHGVSVAEFGLNSFDPMLLEVINGHSNTISHLVGGTIRKRYRNCLHDISIELRGGYIVVLITLFAKYIMPTYEVVSGRVPQSWPYWHLSSTATNSTYIL